MLQTITSQILSSWAQTHTALHHISDAQFPQFMRLLQSIHNVHQHHPPNCSLCSNSKSVHQSTEVLFMQCSPLKRTISVPEKIMFHNFNPEGTSLYAKVHWTFFCDESKTLLVFSLLSKYCSAQQQHSVAEGPEARQQISAG